MIRRISFLNMHSKFCAGTQPESVGALVQTNSVLSGSTPTLKGIRVVSALDDLSMLERAELF